MYLTDINKWKKAHAQDHSLPHYNGNKNLKFNVNIQLIEKISELVNIHSVEDSGVIKKHIF